MPETYAGIDYGLGQSNIDKSTGIRFGVVAQNSCHPEAVEDIFQNGTDVAFAQAKKDFLDVVVERIHHWFNNHSFLNVDEKKQRAKFKEIVLEGLKNCAGSSLSERVAEDTTENWGKTSERDEIIQDAQAAVDNHFGDHYESDGGLNDYTYEKDGYQLTGCLQTDLFIIKSKFYSYAQFCSPCVPGAGNLDSPMGPETGAPRCYCLGHDWFEHDKAPYRVWRVEDHVELIAEIVEVTCPNCNGSGRDSLKRVAEARGVTVEALDTKGFSGFNPGDGTFFCWRCEGKGKLPETQETEGEIDPNYAEAKT